MATSNNDRVSSARLLDTLKGLQASRHLGSEPEVDPQTNEKTKHTIKQDYLPNADWSVNDPEADGYVQGRTHWVEESTVISSHTATQDDASKNMCSIMVDSDKPVIPVKMNYPDGVYNPNYEPSVLKETEGVDYIQFSVLAENLNNEPVQLNTINELDDVIRTIKLGMIVITQVFNSTCQNMVIAIYPEITAGDIVEIIAKNQLVHKLNRMFYDYTAPYDDSTTLKKTNSLDYSLINSNNNYLGKNFGGVITESVEVNFDITNGLFTKVEAIYISDDNTSNMKNSESLARAIARYITENPPHADFCNLLSGAMYCDVKLYNGETEIKTVRCYSDNGSSWHDENDEDVFYLDRERVGSVMYNKCVLADNSLEHDKATLSVQFTHSVSTNLTLPNILTNTNINTFGSESGYLCLQENQCVRYKPIVIPNKLYKASTTSFKLFNTRRLEKPENNVVTGLFEYLETTNEYDVYKYEDVFEDIYWKTKSWVGGNGLGTYTFGYGDAVTGFNVDWEYEPCKAIAKISRTGMNGDYSCEIRILVPKRTNPYPKIAVLYLNIDIVDIE